MSLIKNIIKRLVLVMIGVVFALVAAEIALRFSERMKKEQPRGNPNYDRSAYAYNMDRKRLHPWTQGKTNVFKVAVIGDSISNGAGVQRDDTYGYRLERLLNLNRKAKPAVVHIYAKGGTSTFMQLPFLDMALEWGAKLVILGICLNDMEDWTAVWQIRMWKKERLPPEPKPWQAAILKRSRVLSWVNGKIQAVRGNRGTLKYFRNLYNKDYTGWQKFEGAIDEFKARCAASGAELVVVIFPSMSRVGDRQYPFGYAHDQIGQALKEREIPYIDLRDVFLGKNSVRMQAIPILDPHPSEIAHRMASEAIYESLLLGQFLPEEYAPKREANPEREKWEFLSRRMQYDLDD
jgi:hypothetical protein